MHPILQVLVPIITLILGYLLNTWTTSIESRRNIKRRQIAEKERAYAHISAKLHRMFEVYRIQTFETNLKFDRAELYEPIKGGEMVKQYKELEDLVFEHSLYLKPSIIQALADLKLDDLRTRFQQEPKENKGLDRATFNENHLDRLWSKAKRIMTEMRQELDLGPYPEDVMRIWR